MSLINITALINISLNTFHFGINIYPVNNLLHTCQISLIIEIFTWYRNFLCGTLKNNISISLKLHFSQNTNVLDTYIRYLSRNTAYLRYQIITDYIY